MAGHRRSSGKPTARKRHHDNARALLQQRLAATTDPLQRLEHAYDYLRAAAARAQRRTPHLDISSLESTVRALTAAGDRLIR
ncbi:hypothetical protein L3Q67_45115 (plasmid) [Saccharothrix sp. AJ9571]|nr:hypothetical protein L3Q67_45115 [Saccharothrix sp. AJ9571]